MSPARPPEGARTAAREGVGSPIRPARPPEGARTAARQGAGSPIRPARPPEGARAAASERAGSSAIPARPSGQARAAAHSHADLLRHAQATIRQGSRSFALAAQLLPEPARESAILLYAWCRHCDDVIDGQSLGHGGTAATGGGSHALANLEAGTMAACGDAPLDDPAFAALREVMQHHALPVRYPLDHLAGFGMDVAGRRYETLDDTLQYCYHVAGVVGVMMAHVMGVRDPAVLDRACDLGIGFQLTNIARDVIEDAGIGRVYLPAQWLDEAGIPRDALAAPIHRQALYGVVERLLQAAEPYYASADVGIGCLPGRAAVAIATARLIYHAIGDEIRARGPAAWDTRVSTSASQKLGHVARAVWLAWRAGRTTAPPRAQALWQRPR